MRFNATCRPSPDELADLCPIDRSRSEIEREPSRRPEVRRHVEPRVADERVALGGVGLESECEPVVFIGRPGRQLFRRTLDLRRPNASRLARFIDRRIHTAARGLRRRFFTQSGTVAMPAAPPPTTYASPSRQ